MNFKWDLKHPSLPSGYLYGYKSERTQYPYFPNIELTEEKRNEPHIIIQIYEPYYDNKDVTCTEFCDFIQKDIYENNDFITYEDGSFGNGFTKFGKNDVHLTQEETKVAFLVDEDVQPKLNYLTEISYFEFCELVSEIDEFWEEDPENELRYVTGLGGRFFKLQNKGICCIERISIDYVYVSYLAVFEKYRGKGYFERLIGGIKNKYIDKKITLACVEPKIEEKYLQMGFKKVGYLKNYD